MSLIQFKTCLIRHSLEEKLCVGIDRVSHFTVRDTEKLVKLKWKSSSDNTVLQIRQVSNFTSYTVFTCIVTSTSFLSLSLYKSPCMWIFSQLHAYIYLYAFKTITFTSLDHTSCLFDRKVIHVACIIEFNQFNLTVNRGITKIWTLSVF